MANDKKSEAPHEGGAPLLNKGDDPSPWLEIPHDPHWLNAVSPEGKEQLVCGDCGMRKDKE